MKIVGRMRRAALEPLDAARAAGHEGGALGDAALDVPVHAMPLRFRGEGPDADALIGGVADRVLGRGRDEPLDDLVVAAPRHDEPGPRAAGLTGVRPRVREGVGHDRVDVGLGEDDIRGLAAEFERHSLHGGRGHGHDPPAPRRWSR